MNHLRMFEEFNERDVVEYKGQRARIISKEGTKCDILVLRGGTEHTVDESELSEIGGRCMARCDKRVVGQGNNRQIYCFGCNRKIMGL